MKLYQQKFKKNNMKEWYKLTVKKDLQKKRYYVNIILRSIERKIKDKNKQKNLKNFRKIS